MIGDFSRNAVKSKLKRFCWLIVYPSLLKKEVGKKVDDRKVEMHKEMSNLIFDNTTVSSEYFVEV